MFTLGSKKIGRLFFQLALPLLINQLAAPINICNKTFLKAKDIPSILSDQFSLPF
jgi:hypothetical protein